MARFDGERLRVLYLTWKRAEWRSLLAAAERLEVEELPVHLTRELGSGLGRKLWAARDQLRRFRPQLMLIEYHGVNGLVPLVLRSLAGVPLVVGVKADPWGELAELSHGTSLGHDLMTALNHLSTVAILSRARGLVPISSAIDRSLARNLGGACPRQVVPIPWRGSACGTPGRPVSRGRLLSVSNFGFWRKVRPLVEAVPTVAPCLERLGLEWTVLGDGWFLERCRERLAPWAGRVKLVGRQDAAPHYAERPVFVHLSGLDGLPNVLLEASVAGLPVVVNGDCPAADFVEHERTGLLVDPADPAGLEKAITRLHGEPELAAHLGDNAARHVRERYAVERLADELEDALLRIARSLS